MIKMNLNEWKMKQSNLSNIEDPFGKWAKYFFKNRFIGRYFSVQSTFKKKINNKNKNGLIKI